MLSLSHLLFQRAIAIDPGCAAAHYNLARAHLLRSQYSQAEAGFRAAVQCRDDFPEAWVGLADALEAMGRSEDALSALEKAIALRNDYVGALLNSVALLRKKGRLDVAAAYSRRVLEVEPDNPLAHNALGICLQGLDRPSEAEASYRLALAFNPNSPEAKTNLASLLQTMGRRQEAIQLLFDVVANEPSNPQSRRNLAEALNGLALNRAGEKERSVLLNLCLDDDALAFVIPSIVTLIKNDEGFLALQNSARRAEDPFVAVVPPVAKFLRDPLMLAALPRMTIADVEVEEVLTHVRQCILLRLDLVSGLDAVDPRVPKEFICSLARQCSVSKYAFFATENELQREASLRDAIQDALRQKRVNPRTLESALAVASLYESLHSLKGSERLLEQRMAEWSEPFRPVVQEQIVNREREREIALKLMPITTIDDAISVAVRAQYEENPYPRWVTVQTPNPESIDSLLSQLHPGQAVRPRPRPVQVLIAGCGTGMVPIHCARAYPDTEILAVDLSLASLAYAARMTEQLGLSSITYRQADILKMADLEKHFSVIDCCGVLHHLGDPMAGWRVLVSLLESDGMMKVALYSEKARHAIRAAREYARSLNLPRTAEGIRRCRQSIMEFPGRHPGREVLTYGDFYTLDGCRDMLMPVHECQFTLPRIKECLDQLGLRFLGFVSSVTTQDRFREMFPGDDAGTNLEAWQRFEEINPETFIEMYVFWCCKKQNHISPDQSQV